MYHDIQKVITFSFLTWLIDFEDMVYKDKIDFTSSFDETVNIKWFCARHVPYFSLIREIVVQRVTSIWAFTLNALNPFWYVHPPPLTINVNRCLHQFLWMREKERKFFLQFCFKRSFYLKYITFLRQKMERVKLFSGTKYIF